MNEITIIEYNDAIATLIEEHSGTRGVKNAEITTLITKLKDQRMKRIEYISTLSYQKK